MAMLMEKILFLVNKILNVKPERKYTLFRTKIKGQNLYPFPDQNSSKTIPFGTAVVPARLIPSVCKRHREAVGGTWGKCFGSGTSDGPTSTYLKKKHSLQVTETLLTLIF